VIPDVAARKDALRDAVEKRRTALDSEWIRHNSAKVQERIARMPEFAEAGVVACYMAMPLEVGTDAIMAQSWRDGKVVCVPAGRPEDGLYGLTKVDAGAAMLRGRFGIQEPRDKTWMSAEDVEFVVVPGVAFDPAGGRLGRGGGYYDRMLSATAPAGAGRHGAAPFKAGVAFEFQVVDRVPMTDTDVRMDAVVTEERVIRSVAGT
jgi:5-formyltetrahydrofolate cyclo-ligase